MWYHIFKIEKEISEMTAIESIKNDKVYLKNHEEITIMKVEPINFKLKSISEKSNILDAYQRFLKQCDFDIQIFITTCRVDVSKHIAEIEKCILYEPNLSEMAKDYMNFVKEISEVRGSISRKFYIALRTNDNNRDNRVNKLKEGLESCGNLASICHTEELRNIFQVCFKTI